MAESEQAKRVKENDFSEVSVRAAKFASAANHDRILQQARAVESAPASLRPPSVFGALSNGQHGDTREVRPSTGQTSPSDVKIEDEKREPVELPPKKVPKLVVLPVRQHGSAC